MPNKISLYIPTYNAENTILKSIESVFNQSLKPNEVIIINDCSTDNTTKLIESTKGIKIINNKKNLGLARSRNIALQNSSFNFLASIDSDVVCKKNWLEILFQTMFQKNLHLVGGKLEEVNLYDPINKWRAEYLKQNWGDQSLINPDFVAGSNTLLNKEKISSLGICYDERFKTNGEDVNFSRVLKKNNLKLYYECNAICYHYQNDNLKSLSKRYWRYNYFGAGFKKFTFTRLIRHIIRQIKKFFIWSFYDLIKKKFDFLLINFLVTVNFIVYSIKQYFYEKK